LHYERNYAYPLIVWLHGPQDDERQLKRIMPLISMRNYVAAGPRGTLGATKADGNRCAGFDWSQSEEHIALAEQRVQDAVAAARQRFNVARHRVFLGGFGNGGTMAFRVALNCPNLAAGVLSIGGEFPRGLMPLRNLSQIRQLKVFLATGRDSVRYPQHVVCENLRLLYTAGMAVNLRQYPCGDELTTLMLSDMDRWIMEQVAAPVEAVS
jgi:phospholipase/carboxylesterase